MSDHQFEKNIQEKMDELRLRPSEIVWVEVEKKIRVRKRRRRGLIWLPLLAALLTGIYFYYTEIVETNTDNPQISNKEKSSIPIEVRDSSSHSSTEPVTIKKNNSNGIDLVAPEQIPIENNISQGSEISPDNKEYFDTGRTNTFKKKPEENSPRRIGISRKKQGKVPDKIRISSFKEINEEVAKIQQKKNQTVTSEEENTETNTSSINTDPIVDSISKRDVQISEKPEADIPEILKSDLAVQSSPVERIKRKWQIGVAFHAGVNKIASGSFLDFTEKSMVQDVAPSNFSMPVPRNAVIQKPSTIHPGFAMHIRGFATTELRKRLHVSVGMGYGLYQTQIRVGQMVQSNQVIFTSNGAMDVQGFYRAEPNEVYTNRFHFVEIPLQVEYRLNKKRQIPILLHAGATYSRLIGTNALHFDGSSRVYYKDNSVFNKNLAGVTGGFSIGILQSSRHPLSFGPSFHYRISNLMHHNTFDRKHLFAAGIDVKMLLKKS